MDKKIFFLGAGNMAESIIAALLREQVFEPQNVIINDISAERMSYMAGEYHVTALSDPVMALKNADIFVIAAGSSKSSRRSFPGTTIRRLMTANCASTRETTGAICIGRSGTSRTAAIRGERKRCPRRCSPRLRTRSRGMRSRS